MTHLAMPGAAISCAVALALVVSARPLLAQTPLAVAPPVAAPPVAAPPVATPPSSNEGTPEAAAPKGEPSAKTPAIESSAPNAAVAPPAEEPKPSWFYRPPLRVGVGSGSANQQFSLTFYGFVEADFITDSTRSYGDSIGASLVARSDTYKGRAGRTQFSMRNTRLGLKFASPEVGGFRPSAVLEGDFFGPSSIAETSENSVYSSPTFRVRHAYVALEGDYLSVLAGQTYDVFGWQNYFFPCSAEFLGLPNQVFSRSTQLRLSHTFGGDGPVTLDVAAAAARPAQRDSRVPDAHAGLRVGVPSFKGITTPGNSSTTALPLSLGVSGIFRQFRVNAFAPPPAQSSNGTNGWGLSLDALVPVISAHDADDRGNRLTLTGSFVTGSGIADLITSNGGAGFPTLPNPAQANPPPEYDANIDPGLVSFDTQGVVHTIDWQAFRAGLQYYLPPSGRVMLSANYTQAHSKNMAKLFPKGGAEIELLGRVADTCRYADVNLFWDASPAVRFGISGQYTQVEYLDGETPHNLRGMLLALYAF